MNANRHDRATDIALFRYGLVREAASPELSSRGRGELVRALAAKTHAGPDWTPYRVSRQTIDRWIRAYRAGGFDALRPTPRRVEARTPAGLLALACDLRREDPSRTAAHIAEMIRATHEWSPHPRTPAAPLPGSGADPSGAHRDQRGLRPLRGDKTQ